MILFALSAALLVFTAAAIVRWFPAHAATRFWVFAAGVNLLLTSSHLVASLYDGLTPAGFLIAQAGIAAVVLFTVRGLGRTGKLKAGPWPRPALRVLSWPGWRSPLAALLTAALVLTIGLSAAEQLIRPVTGFDERMYNCSRIIYWLQHRNIWPWVTHNDAQIDFPIGSEVFFSWPLIFTREEWTGRLVYWLGYPGALFGAYFLARQLRAPRAGAVGASLMIAATPTILYLSGINQKQDLWTAAMFLGAAYWIIRCWKHPSDLNTAMAGLSTVVAINVKITCSAIAPLAVVAVFAAGGGLRASRRRLRIQAVAVAGALLVSGLGITMAHNLRSYGHPFGSPAAARVVAPEWSSRQVYTHIIRAGLYLLELPIHPSPAFRRWWIDTGTDLIYRLDAHRALPGERRGMWPGYFRFDETPAHDSRAYRYSLGGMIWLGVMVWFLFRCIRRIFIPSGPVRRAEVALLISVVQFGALLFLLRWTGGSPERYWIAPYALGVTGACALISRGARRSPAIAVLAVLALAYTVGPSVSSIWTRHVNLRHRPITTAMTDFPFVEVAGKVPPGSTILLVANRNTREYPLFLPRQRYANRIVSWGRVPPDLERLKRMIDDNRVTHVLFESDVGVGFHWYKGFKTAEMIEWLIEQPEFRQVSLETPRQVLFERIRDR